MKVKLVWNGIVMNAVSFYAPQVGLGQEEEQFWAMYDVLVSEIREG